MERRSFQVPFQKLELGTWNEFLLQPGTWNLERVPFEEERAQPWTEPTSPTSAQKFKITVKHIASFNQL